MINVNPNLYYYQLSFEGLGIGKFHIDSTAFRIGGIEVKWYGAIIAIGMILAVLYAFTRAKIEKIKTDDIIDYAIFCIIFGVIGARLYYIAFELDSFIKGSFWETVKSMVNIRGGGLAIYGAVIAGIITIYVVSKVKKIRFTTMLDVIAPSVMIGQILGRWGNFCNIEAFGEEVSETFLFRMGIFQSASVDSAVTKYWYVHPTFLYESVWNLVGFILITIFYKKKKFNGQIFYAYMGWYGFGRFFIEGLRTDSLMIGENIRVSQVLAAVLFVFAVVMTVINLVKAAKYNKLLKESAVEEAGVLEKSAEAVEEESTEESEETEETEETEESKEETEENTENDNG